MAKLASQTLSLVPDATHQEKPASDDEDLTHCSCVRPHCCCGDAKCDRTNPEQHAHCCGLTFLSIVSLLLVCSNRFPNRLLPKWQASFPVSGALLRSHHLFPSRL